MHTLLPLTESTNPVGARGGECKQSRDSYVKLIPVQKALIAKYASQWPAIKLPFYYDTRKSFRLKLIIK